MYTQNPWIYTPDRDNTARYTLGQPSSTGRNLVCFGINPSTAEPDKLDPTLKSVARIARLNGYDGWIMLNVYPQRATNPNDMHTEHDVDLHQNNLQHITRIITDYNCDIWAAWGTLIYKRKYLSNLLHEVFQATSNRVQGTTFSGGQQGRTFPCAAGTDNIRWLSFGPNSKQGHPHHPLYLRSDSVPAQFDMVIYLDSL